MDQDRLEQLLKTIDQHQCWVKPIGWSKHPVEETADFSQEEIRLDFAKRSQLLQKDDILLVYAVGHRKLIYIGTCNTPMLEASTADLTKQPERTRWPYWVNTINHTPSFGRQWSHYSVRLFDYLEQHNRDYPVHTFTIGGLNHGLDKLKVPTTFATMIIHQVMALSARQ